ncbi:MAG: hypothetical protein HY514_04765 [Candidatus Aenigmarchaeota archaeon]|nr:hypothetical protein [Candidatus Aenigmarchaeota archaeon]
MAPEEVAILLNGEELPTNEKVRYLTVEILSQEERERIKELQEKVEKLLESGALQPEVASRLDLVFASLEKIAERVDEMKRPYDLDLVIEDVKHKLSEMTKELDIVSSYVSKKLDSSLQRFDAKTDAVTDAVSSIAYVKNDMQAAFSGMESYGKIMENRLTALTDNLRNFLTGFERKIDDLGRVSGSLEVMKEEVGMSIGDAANKLESQIDAFSSGVSDLSSLKKDFIALQDSTKETNIKLAILIDSVEQKVFELTELFSNIENIEKGIAAQTNSLKNIASFMKEFIERAEERSIKLDNMLVDFDAFRDRLNEEVKKILDLVDERTAGIGIAAMELSSLRSQLDAKFEDLDAIKDEMSEAVYSINKNAPLMEKAAADILDIHSLVSTSAERLERSADDLRSMAQQSEDFIATQKSISSELKTATDTAERTMKAMQSVESQLDGTARAVDRKTDDILNVLLRKVNDLENINTAIEKNSGGILSAANKLENIVDKLDALPQVKSIKRGRKRKRKSVTAVAKSRTAATLKKLPMKRAKRRRRRKTRRAKKAVALVKKRPAKALKRLEDEALDLLIFNSLKNVRMTIDSLAEATNVNETRLRKRLKTLIAEDKIKKERQGRYVFYSSNVEVV